MNKLIIFLFAFAISGGLAPSRADEKVASGHDFALKVCSACHVVAADQGFAPILKPPAPSFSAIARRKNPSEVFLRQFLSAPHGTKGESSRMPNPRLADYQIDEVTAYLLSLKSR